MKLTFSLVSYQLFPIIKDKSNISRFSNILNGYEYLFLVITGYKHVLLVRVLKLNWKM